MFTASLSIESETIYGLDALDTLRRLKLPDEDYLFVCTKPQARDIGEAAARLIGGIFLGDNHANLEVPLSLLTADDVCIACGDGSPWMEGRTRYVHLKDGLSDNRFVQLLLVAEPK